MSTPADAQAAGLAPADREFLDLSRVQKMKEPRNPSAQLMTKEQAGAAALALAAATSPLSPTPTSVYNPAAAPAPQSSGLANPGAAPAEPAVIPFPVSPPAQAAPPILPGDTPRVQDRINKLFGRARTAEERAADAEARYADLLARVEARLGGPSGPPPAAPGYGPPQFSPSLDSFGSPQPPAAAEPPGAGPITRAELAQILAAQTRFLVAQNALAQAHSVSLAEAQRDFPDVFMDPELKAAADQLWRSDPRYQNDPNGPYTAAALVRGLARPRGVPQVPGGQPATVRKEALSAVGISVPEGPPQPDDRQARYDAAKARAQATGREEDAALARMIALGLA